MCLRIRNVAVAILLLLIFNTFDLFAGGEKIDESEKVKVFILAGQSNMVGKGVVEGDQPGTLKSCLKDPKFENRLQGLVESDGSWLVRDDVWVSHKPTEGDPINAGLTVGQGRTEKHMGPEMGFGHVMGEYYNEQVLLIKTCWGGKSLVEDFRPPSAEGETGIYYEMMVEDIGIVLAELKKRFPEYKGQGYEIAGFGWHQGWNDGAAKSAGEYTELFKVLVQDLRKELEVPELPVVIATSGFNPTKPKGQVAHYIRDELEPAQIKAGEETENAVVVKTRDFCYAVEDSPAKDIAHWNRHAGTYFLIGEHMAKELIKLIDKK